MQTITGGFCGHGHKTHVTVDSKTLARTCGDCGLVWSKSEDVDTPRVVNCAEESARKAAAMVA